MKSTNFNLISLKWLLFVFFGGAGCLLTSLTSHMRNIGLNSDEIRIVAIVSPCISLLGPLIVGPLADRLGIPSQGSTARYGHYMRSMLVMVTVAGAFLYSLLLFVPSVSRLHARNPAVTFICNTSVAVIMQEKCLETPCFDWPENNEGSIFLSGCRYDCGDGLIKLYNTKAQSNKTENPGATGGLNFDELEMDTNHYNTNEPKERKKRENSFSDVMDPPHLCMNSNNNRICHVYTQYSKQLVINVSLQPSPELVSYSDWCTYKVAGDIKCNQPNQNNSCSVVCDLDDPYTLSDSLLTASQCKHTVGDPNLTFWLYLIIRSVADIFPTTAFALLISCLSIAAREKVDLIGQQLLFAVVGFSIVPYIVLKISDFITEDLPVHVMFISFAALNLISALIIIFARSLPLSPVDYHLHSGTGHLTLKGAGGETASLMFVLMLFGVLRSALDVYFPLTSFLIGVLPSVVFLYFAKLIVDYCGYSNLLISAFTFYIIRYIGLLIFTNDHWPFILLGTLEIFSLVIVWGTSVLYLHHLVPSHLSVTSQAFAVIVFFCLGRCLGAVLSGLLGINNLQPSEWSYISYRLYKVAAILSALIATLYFIIYHCCLKPVCKKSKNDKKYRNPQSAVYGINSNGTYTPLKIYNPPDKGQQKRY
uniref:Major facilitator superfamily associated domain-containing protein n=2 Tax=Clastoptera arizonana TaxID=38151 RepID=A0A1B6CZA8_9HEMI